MHDYEKALEVLEFKREFGDTETREALDTAIHCINIVSAVESPELAEVLSAEEYDEFLRRKLEMNKIMAVATPQQREQIVRYLMSN